MAKFLTPLVMGPVDNGRRWRIQSPLVYVSDVKGVGKVCVRAGFVCDLNSMPRLAWIVAPKTDYPEAGVVHDWLYKRTPATQAQADAVYREALQVLGMGKSRSGFRYYALRVFGRFSFHKQITEAK